LQRRLIERLIGHGRIFEYDGHAIIPAPIFRGVIARLTHPHLHNPPHFHFFLQYRIVIFLEQLQKLIRMPPLGFVVILDDKWSVGSWARRLSL
jgi:hypothetical protein